MRDPQHPSSFYCTSDLILARATKTKSLRNSNFSRYLFPLCNNTLLYGSNTATVLCLLRRDSRDCSQIWDNIVMLLSIVPFILIFNVVASLDASSLVCDSSASQNEGYRNYFNGMKKIYRNAEEGTCIPIHRECGWPKQNSHLPQFVLVIGLEGSGHHFWTDLYIYVQCVKYSTNQLLFARLNRPIHDCVWVLKS
jgi:hypothetical protein